MKGNLVVYTGLSKAPALTRFELHHAHFCSQLRPLHPLSPNAPRWSAASRFVVFGRSAPRSRCVQPLLTTEMLTLREKRGKLSVVSNRGFVGLIIYFLSKFPTNLIAFYFKFYATNPTT